MPHKTFCRTCWNSWSAFIVISPSMPAFMSQYHLFSNLCIIRSPLHYVSKLSHCFERYLVAYFHKFNWRLSVANFRELQRPTWTRFWEGIQWVSSPPPPKSKLWLLIIMRWQVHHIAKLGVIVVRFRHRVTHWWAAPLYQKQWNCSRLNNWLDCLS